MADVGEVKAKVIIEYDGSGLEQAKKDLASLAEIGGSVGESAGQASEGLAGLDQQMGKNAESAKSFGAAIDELPKMVESGGTAVSEMTSALDEHQAAIEETGSAYEALQSPIESTVSLLQEAGPPMQVIAKNAESMATQITPVGDSFAQLGESLSQTVPMLPQFAESMHAVSESFDPKAFGLDVFAENTAVFQNALADPAPFSMMKEHLLETGQTWSDFASSLSDGNAAMFDEMVQRSSGSYQVLDKTASSARNIGTSFTDSAKSANEFTAQFNGLNESVSSANKSINEFGGVGKSIYGPELPPGGVGKVAGIGDIFGGATEGLMGVLNDIAMPLMAIQMVGMAVQAVGQSIYDSAAIAEGPAAHSLGTFTGTVDALGQSAQKVGAQFSEGFGQGVLPTLNAMNYQVSQTNGGGIGGFLGGIASTAANLWQLGTGSNIIGGLEGLANQGASAFGLQQPFQGPGPISQYQQQMAQMSQTVQANAQQLQYQASLTMADATNPTWLAANNQASASQRASQYLIQDYDIRHPQSQYDIIQQAREQSYDAQQNQAYRQAVANSPSYLQSMLGNIGAGNWGGALSDVTGGIGDRFTQAWQSQGGAFNSIGDFFSAWGNNFMHGGETPYQSASTWGPGSSGSIMGGPGSSINFGGILGGAGSFFGGVGDWFSHLFGGGGGVEVPASTFGGCFIAGTHVLMADGSSKTIETLQIGERVLAHNGKKQVHATITDCITFPAKQTYKLVFSDGPILFTTDSHPIATTRGWKSISPASTAQENPGLPVTTLAVGDNIYTADGTICHLVSLQKHDIVQVFNITVNASHTYYANNILVHNAKLGSSGGMTNGGVGSEQVSLSHTFTANVTWEANNLAKQFTGVASWAAQGLSNTFQGIANWVGQGLSNTFQGIANWVGQGLSNTFQGIANWVGQGLQNTFQGIANWVGQGLQNTFQGVANWVGQGLNNTFKGIASWLGSGLEHTFNAVANWTAQNLTPNFTVNPSFTMLAEGTSNWGGGPAIVGEAGPEVVESNGQYSMFNQGASLVDLPSGSNVYPMKNLQSSSVTQFADGIGGGAISSGGSSSGNIPQSINLHLQIGDAVFSQMGISLAQNMRLTAGLRGY
jgi:hypothetical protein